MCNGPGLRLGAVVVGGTVQAGQLAGAGPLSTAAGAQQLNAVFTPPRAGSRPGAAGFRDRQRTKPGSDRAIEDFPTCRLHSSAGVPTGGSGWPGQWSDQLDERTSQAGQR
jgi:hypothetical protein